MESIIDIHTIFLVLFVAYFTYFLYTRRKKVIVGGVVPLLYMVIYRSAYGIRFMKRFPKKYPLITKGFVFFSVCTALIGLLGSIYLLIRQIEFMIANHITSGGGLVLPINVSGGGFVYYVPFLYWIISLFCLALVHEAAHGVVAEYFSIAIRASGFAFIGCIVPLLPAAFVEPDERHVERASLYQRLAVYGAGSASNIIFGAGWLILYIFAAGALASSISVQSIDFQEVHAASDLLQVDQAFFTSESGYRIIELNGAVNAEQQQKILSDVTDQTYDITLERLDTAEQKEFTIYAQERAGNWYLGLQDMRPEVIQETKWWTPFMVIIVELLKFLWLLNIAIGIFNLLPLWITDGGQILGALLEPCNEYVMSGFLFNILCLLTLGIVIVALRPGVLL